MNERYVVNIACPERDGMMHPVMPISTFELVSVPNFITFFVLACFGLLPSWVSGAAFACMRARVLSDDSRLPDGQIQHAPCVFRIMFLCFQACWFDQIVLKLVW